MRSLPLIFAGVHIYASDSFIHNVRTNQITKNTKFVTSAISLAIYPQQQTEIRISFGQTAGRATQEIAMFTCRQLILAVIIISSINIIFADILIEPDGYKRQNNNNPFYPQYQSVLQYMPSTSEQYTKQLTGQHPSKVQIVHPFYVPGVYQDKIRSSLVGYPHHSHLHHYPYHHYMSRRPIGNLHYMKLGSREYVRPSIFIAHPNPLTAHYRRKRSTDFTNIKSSKSATHDVATKPSLIDTKYPIAIDSLLPKNESTNTNDKHVKKSPSDFATKSFLFGLDPNKMYSGLQAKDLGEKNQKNLDQKKDETQHSVSKRNYETLVRPVILTQFTPVSAKTTVTEPVQQTLSTSQEKEQNQESSRTNHENLYLTPNTPVFSTNLEQSSSPITTSQMQSSEEESYEDYSKYSQNYDSTYAYTSPMVSMAYHSVPLYRWPLHYTPNAETHPSKKTKDPDQQNTATYQISSQETTNINKTNKVQPNESEYTNVHLCADGFPCPKNNTETKKPPSKSVTSTLPTIAKYMQQQRNQESSTSEIIGAPNPGTSQIFYTIPDDYTNYYLNDYPKDNMRDYLDNLKTDYQDYDYYYDDKPTYLTDGFHIYMKRNFAYSSYVPSNKIYSPILYRNINVPPMTYVISTSSNIPQVQEQFLYYYPKKVKKMYVTYKPQRYNYYKHFYDTIHSSYQKVPRVVYHTFSSPVYY